MATALDVIKGALRRIVSYQSGEAIAAPDAQDCLEALNDMLDSWSTDHLSVFGSTENILQWTANKNQYRIGNPTNDVLGYANIIGTIVGNVITTTSVPSQLVAGSSILYASTVTDLQNIIPVGTYVTAVTSTTITLSNSVTSSSTGNDTIYWTVPGDFGIERPLRITSGYTRINQLDFTLDVAESQDRYNEILYKAQPGPWPTVAWYNNQMPYGILNVYQTPGFTAELHLFTDGILQNLSLNQELVVPQGYIRALKWNLAKEICAEYGFPLSDSIRINAKESYDMVKAINARPAVESRYDRELTRENRPDGGWITHGGFR